MAKRKRLNPDAVLEEFGISNVLQAAEKPTLINSRGNSKPTGRTSDRVQEVVAGPQPSLILRPGDYATPVPEAPVKESLDRDADLSMYGAAGTAIISGFVTELSEYNGELRGRNAIATYEKMRRSDADIAAILAAIKLPIRAAEYKVIPGAKENEPEYQLAKQLAEFVEDCLFGGLEYTNQLGMRFSQRFESVIENALLCLDFGCSGYEDLWRIDGNYVKLHRMAPRLPMTFYRFHVEEDGETLRSIEQWGYRGNSFVNVVVPADKFTLFSYRQEGANFYGRAVLREAYQHWYVKNALYRIETIACERNGAGVPVITMGPNASPEDKTFAATWLSSLAAHEQTGLVLPNGYTFRLEATSGTEHKIGPSVQHHSEMICRSVLAMFMTLGSSATGSRALGNTMVDFFQLSEEATGKFVCDTITETTIRRLIDLNFYRGEDKPLPYPRLVIPNIAVLNPLDMLEAVKSIASSTVDLIQPDDDTENWLRKKIGMPLKSKTARVRFAPVVQRVEEQAANPDALEDGKPGAAATPGQAPAKPGQTPAAPLSPEDAQKQIQDRKEAEDKAKAAGEGKDTTGRGKGSINDPSSEKAQPKAPAGAKPGDKKPPVTDDTKIQKTEKKTFTLAEPTRDLRPEEKKHNFQGHVDRQDSTAVAVRRIIGGSKAALAREAARRIAVLRPEHYDTLTLPFDKQLQGRLTKSLTIASQYGSNQVYAERYRATGRTKKELPKRELMIEFAPASETLSRHLHYKLRWNGLSISIENAAGSVRTARDGSWQNKMTYPYGYIGRTEGADGDHIDCYVGPVADAENVYIVHQNNPSTGAYDEDKCFLNFESEAAAKKAFLENHSSKVNALGPITTLTVDEFKAALKSNNGKIHLNWTKSAETLAERRKSADEDKPSLIAETSLSDLNNWASSRARGAAVDAYKQGLRDEDLEDYVIDNLLDGSDSFLDRIADEAARSAVAGGRYSALEELQDEIATYVRSEAMDQNTCDACDEGDGTEWDSLDDVDWSPGDDCEGKDACRGQLMPVFADEDTTELED